MAVNRGVQTSSISFSITSCNVKVIGISSPASGATVRGNAVSINFVLQSYVESTASVTMEYSLNGVDWEPMTEGSGGDGISGLSVNSSGVTSEFIWDALGDLPSNEKTTGVSIRIIPNDGVVDGDPVGRSSITVDHLPQKGNILSPSSGYFSKFPTDTNIVSEIPLDPGVDNIYPRLLIYDSDNNIELELDSVDDPSGWQIFVGSNIDTQIEDDAQWNDIASTGLPDGSEGGYCRYEWQAGDSIALGDYTFVIDFANISESSFSSEFSSEFV